MGCGPSKEVTPSVPPNRSVQQTPGAPANRAAVQRPGGPPYGSSQRPNAPPYVASQQPASPAAAQQLPPGLSFVQKSSSGAWPKIIQPVGEPFIVRVYSRIFQSTGTVPSMRCWIYISDGLSTLNQPEIVFCIKQNFEEKEDNVPAVPLEWMAFVRRLATSGIQLHTGQLCQLIFQGDALLIQMDRFTVKMNSSNWKAIERFGSLVHGIKILESCLNLPEGTVPADAHHVIALTPEETAVAKQFGVTRVVAHVGLAIRWFPHPPFIDRDRTDTVTMADQANSIRIGLPMARMYGLNARQEEKDLIFTIPKGDERREVFKKYVRDSPVTAALGFESFLIPAATGGYVWKAGQKGPKGYIGTSGGKR
jgi:hypothetical protein